MSNDLYRLNVFVLNFVQRVQDCSGKANLLVTRAGFERLLLTLDEMYGLLTKCEVKMAGYWPSYFFACLWTETESRSINTQKMNEANIQPS